ncbi:MAG: phage holin family protein [Actinobacteria bacterium]|nr:phage holin family protein [Actinomycetota bacterium]
MQQSRDNRSLGELFSELAQETSTLVRQEVNLAKTEMSHKASRAGKHVGVLAAGGAVAYAGLLAILAGVIVLLDNVMPLWVSALLVGVVLAIVGYLLVRRALDALKREDFAPRETIETLKEDQQWAKEQTR